MLMQPATEDMLRQWKETQRKYRSKLSPNRKTGEEVAAYLCREYETEETMEKRYRDAVVGNVLENGYSSEKLPQGAEPKVRVFHILREGKGEELYREQDAIFSGLEIYVGIELETGYLQVEGSSALYDELFFFRGLDERDLENCFLVAQ